MFKLITNVLKGKLDHREAVKSEVPNVYADLQLALWFFTPLNHSLISFKTYSFHFPSSLFSQMPAPQLNSLNGFIPSPEIIQQTTARHSPLEAALLSKGQLRMCM